MKELNNNLKPKWLRAGTDYIPLDHFLPETEPSKALQAYQKTVSNMNNTDKLIETLANKSEEPKKRIKALTKAKIEELGGFVNETAAIHIVAKDLNIKLYQTDDLGVLPDWVRVANIEVATGEFKPNKGYEEIFEGIKSPVDLDLWRKVANTRHLWAFIGNSELNQTDKGCGVFLRLSKSGNAVFFFIGETCYTSPCAAILDETAEFIGISTREKT